MKSAVTWRSKFTFDGRSRQHAFVMDASQALGGQDLGPTPKELVLAAICACTGMDVVGLLRKKRLELRSLVIEAEANSAAEHPKIFDGITLTIAASGDEPWRTEIVDAAKASQSLYCGVSAMLARACPIAYRVIYNGVLAHEAQAAFEPPRPVCPSA